MVIEEVAVLIALVRRHRRAVGAAVRRAVQPRCALCPQVFWTRCLYMPLVKFASLLLYETLVRARTCAMMSQMWLTSPDISANAPITKTSTRPPLYLLSAVAIGPSKPGGWPFYDSQYFAPSKARFFRFFHRYFQVKCFN